MFRCNVRTPADALVYLTDCTLATVSEMASKKSRPKGEFKRQMEIAQISINWMLDMGIDVGTTRAKDAILAGSVEKWAEQWFPESMLKHRKV